jgi:hypothetical protein
MDESSLERIGRNEGLFREVNEAIERGLWPGEDERAAFRCECAQLECNVTIADYERIRKNPRRFVIVGGHELPEAEDVVERSTDWIVVEKRGQAGVVAESTDPRS